MRKPNPKLDALLNKLSDTIQDLENDKANMHASYLLKWLMYNDFGEANRTFLKRKHEFQQPTIDLIEQVLREHPPKLKPRKLTEKQLGAFTLVLTNYDDYHAGRTHHRDLGIYTGRQAGLGDYHHSVFRSLAKLHLVNLLDKESVELSKPLHTMVFDGQTLAEYPGTASRVYNNQSATAEVLTKEHHLSILNMWRIEAERDFNETILLPSELVQKYITYLEKHHYLNDPDFINL